MAAATPIAGAPRTRNTLMASHISSGVLQLMQRCSAGRRVWSINCALPSRPPTHSTEQKSMRPTPVAATDQRG